ncbi:hypothetical protein GPECTOR_2g1142 [Gonium pectorale]|uniref:Uncharacterized protein n=1 Tax=Gonium pectorale TaxID=33097 RepID=A0A150H0S9_GONPE|nr:hypothetical protein GPECTOR_2g1142 [Gonium pectorale]|eukprot:KXZ55592.1 hypothetical protein GPECTOR_2g1142 [Gonium pectorale]
MWLKSATSLLGLAPEEVQVCCRRHPWLLLADLQIIKTVVVAMTRVLSVPEVQVARTALANPDMLELEPMDAMEHLLYISSTTDMPYDDVVQMALGCPQLLTTQPRDVVRAWADVRSMCGPRGADGQASVSAAGAAAGSRGRGEGSRSGSESQAAMSGGAIGSRGDEGDAEDEEADADADLQAAVLEALRRRPELLVMRSEEIRREMAAGFGAAGAQAAGA